MGQYTWLLLMSMIGLCCILLVMDLKQITSEGGKCLISPTTYGINKFSELNNADLVCSCRYNVQNSPTIIIDRENISIYQYGYNGIQ